MLPSDDIPTATTRPNLTPDQQGDLFKEMFRLARQEGESGAAYRKKITASPQAAKAAAQEIATAIGIGGLADSEIIVFLPDRSVNNCNVFSLELPADFPPEVRELRLADFQRLGYPQYKSINPT